MIPKIIHYCWFGTNKIPKDIQFFISTWKKYCPDYEIKEWNENNFDVNQNLYCKEAYEAKKWAFVSDYVRLKVLYDYGGIYMDTDIEVCKSFNDLLIYNSCLGFEAETRIQTGVIAACKNNEWIKMLLLYYSKKHFKNENGQYALTTNVEVITKIIKEKYDIKLNNTFQVFGDNNVIFPFDYLCAKDLMDGKIKRTNNTYTIHHFKGSWVSYSGKIRHLIKIILVKLFGVKVVMFLKRQLRKE